VKTGPRKWRVQVQRATVTRNGFNEEVETWAKLCDAYAEIKFGTGAERREAAQERATAPATFIVPDTPLTRTLTPRDRISSNGIWEITSAVPGGFNDRIEVTAVRKADVAAVPES
jgi:head-tail adaptor